MSRSGLHPAVLETLESRRLGRLDASRHRFTVSREAALLRLREQAVVRAEGMGDEIWLWTLHLVRAANALGTQARAVITVGVDPDDDEREQLRFDVVVPGAAVSLTGLELGDVLAGALEPDLGPPLPEGDEGDEHDEGDERNAGLDDPAVHGARFRAALGRALNDALAFKPTALELETPVGGRRFTPREQVDEDRDPYGVRRMPALDTANRFVVTMTRVRPSLGGRLGRWVRGRSRTEAVIVELWQRWILQERLPEEEPESSKHDGGASLSLSVAPTLAAPALRLGRCARLGPLARLGVGPSWIPPVELASGVLSHGLWLVRDGVRLLDLRPQLTATGLMEGASTSGWVECPNLRLTADESSVVRDANFELLLAWLHDVQARVGKVGPRSDSDPDANADPNPDPDPNPDSDSDPDPDSDPDSDSGAGEDPGVYLRWPVDPFVDVEAKLDLSKLVDLWAPGLRWADGKPVAKATFVDDLRRGRELVYVWRHQAMAVPNRAKSSILAPWPSELELVRQTFPEAHLVPLVALGVGQRDVDPADLSALRGDSLEPLVLARDSPISAGEGSGSGPGVPDLLASLRVSVEAYVHRSPMASRGFISILAYDRRVSEFTEHERVFPGVTLLCRVSPGQAESVQLDIASLRQDQRALGAIADFARARAVEHWEGLLAHAMSRAGQSRAVRMPGDPVWETPLLRTALLELRPSDLGLRYRKTEHGLRLSWRDSALLDVEVGERGGSASRVETQTVTLRDALRQLREPGAIVLAGKTSYSTLRSDDPRFTPWRCDERQRGLLETVLGRGSVLVMPVVPEVYPRVMASERALIDEQRHLIRSANKIAVDRERRYAADGLPRRRLLGDLLVARGSGADTHGLEGVPLLARYDPRAMSPTRLVSLDAALSERPLPGLVPIGAVHRGLARPVIEVSPGVAALLAAVTPLTGVDTSTIGGAGGRSSSSPLSRREASTTGAADHRAGESSAAIRRARSLPPLLAAPLVDTLVIGRLSVAGDASSEGISLWSGGLRQRELRLPEPLGRVGGRLLLTPQGARVEGERIDARVRDAARALIADAPRQRALLSPLGTQRDNLDHFIAYARQRIGPGDPFDLAEVLGAEVPDDRAERVARLQRMSLEAAPLRPLPRRREALLAQIVTQSLAMKVHFDTSMFSWRAAKLGKRRRDGSQAINFGLRNRWIQGGLDEDRELELPAHRRAALLAGAFVVAEFMAQLRERDELDIRSEHLTVALWRLLKLVD